MPKKPISLTIEETNLLWLKGRARVVAGGSVSEAVDQLVAEGLLEQTPNRGAVVVRLTRQDIIELFELREALEVFAAGKAARQPSMPVELERMERQGDEIRELRDELNRSGKPASDAR